MSETSSDSRRRYDSSARRAQAARTRERIVAAAVELVHDFASWNWDELTFRAVAARAGVGERTVYRHFPTERHLHDAVMARLEQDAGITYEDVTLANLPDVTARVFASLQRFSVGESVNTPPDPTFAEVDRRRRDALLERLLADSGISAEFKKFAQTLPDRVIAHLRLLDGDYGGFPIDRYAHSLQTATRAWRDGRDEEYVVCALLHDIGDTLATHNHPDVAAALLKPFVSEQNFWMIQNHAIFQGYYFFHHLGLDREVRSQFVGHAWYACTEEFCELYDSPAFDPKAETLPLSEFEPLLRRVFAAPRRSLYDGAMAPAARAAV